MDNSKKQEMIDELSMEFFELNWDNQFPHTSYQNIVGGKKHFNLTAKTMYDKDYKKIESIVNKYINEN